MNRTAGWISILCLLAIVAAGCNNGGGNRPVMQQTPPATATQTPFPTATQTPPPTATQTARPTSSASPTAQPSSTPTCTSFTSTGSLKVDRFDHTSTVLPGGNVLIAGGFENFDGTVVLASAELYDAAGASSTLTGTMATARAGHTATLLNDGEVLIAGGEDASQNSLNSAEIYDPATGKFTVTGNLHLARVFHTATLLSSGKVLIAGGYDKGLFLNSTELYTP